METSLREPLSYIWWGQLSSLYKSRIFFLQQAPIFSRALYLSLISASYFGHARPCHQPCSGIAEDQQNYAIACWIAHEIERIYLEVQYENNPRFLCVDFNHCIRHLIPPKPLTACERICPVTGSPFGKQSFQYFPSRLPFANKEYSTSKGYVIERLGPKSVPADLMVEKPVFTGIPLRKWRRLFIRDRIKHASLAPF